MSEPAFLPSLTVQPAMQVFPLPATTDAPADQTAFSGLLKALQSLSDTPTGAAATAAPDGAVGPDATLFAALSFLAANGAAEADGPAEPLGAAEDPTDIGAHGDEIPTEFVAPGDEIVAEALEPALAGPAAPTVSGPPLSVPPFPAATPIEPAHGEVSEPADTPVSGQRTSPDVASPLSRAAEAFAAALLGALKEKTTAPDPEPDPVRELNGTEKPASSSAGLPVMTAEGAGVEGVAGDGEAPSADSPTGLAVTPPVGGSAILAAMTASAEPTEPTPPVSVLDSSPTPTAGSPALPGVVPPGPPAGSTAVAGAPVSTSPAPASSPATPVPATAPVMTSGAAASLAETVARIAAATGTSVSVTVTAAPVTDDAVANPPPATPVTTAIALPTEAPVDGDAPIAAVPVAVVPGSVPEQSDQMTAKAPTPPPTPTEPASVTVSVPVKAEPLPGVTVQATAAAPAPVAAPQPTVPAAPIVDAMAVDLSDAAAPTEPTRTDAAVDKAGDDVVSALEAAFDGGEGDSGSAGDDQPGGQPPEQRAKSDTDRLTADALADNRPADPSGSQRQTSPLAAAALAFAARLRADGAGAERTPEGQPAVAMLGAAQTYGGTTPSASAMPFLMSQPAIAVPLQRLGMEIAKQAGAGETSFQIRLDPAELGRVDVRLEIGEGGETRAHLTVERRDTLELLARDQRTLERALRDAGFDSRDGSVSLSLRQNGGGEGQARQGRDDPTGNGQDQSGRARGMDDTDDRTVRPALDPYRPRRDSLLDVRI